MYNTVVQLKLIQYCISIVIEKKKRHEITNVNEDVEKESLCTVDGNVNWYSRYKKQMEVPQKLKLELLYDPTISLPGIYPNKTKSLFRRDIYTPPCSLQNYSQ